MSSHHVIRDEQEPPIVILTVDFNLSLVNDLLGWSPLLIVVEEVLPLFEARNIKVDYILWDEKTSLKKHQSAKYLQVENYSKLSMGKIDKILNGKTFTAVNVFCTSDTRSYLLSDFNPNNAFTQIPIVLFVNNQKTIVCPRKKYVKWYPRGQKLLFNGENIKVSPSVIEENGFFLIETDAKYEFNSVEDLIILTEY